MKNRYQLLFIAFFCVLSVQAVDYDVISPDERLKIKINVNDGTQYEIWHEQTQLIAPSTIGLNLANGMIVGKGTVKSAESSSVDREIDVLIGKNASLRDAYNELTISYNEGYDLVVRAYNEGLAYHFATQFPDDIIINSEDFIFNFTNTTQVYFPECSDETDMGNYEKIYKIYNAISDIPSDKFSISPVMYSFTGSAYKIVITEADTYDYPGLYVKCNGENSMRGMWAQYPKTVKNPDDIYSTHDVLTRYDYIANTTGTRSFPWRVFIVSDDDKSLLNNELVYLLAEPQKLSDTSWITPGKSTWEWWHQALLSDVDFPVGNDNLSFRLYRYYVDFAAANNIQYLTLDAGWSETYIKQLCDYARARNVKILVWVWATVPRLEQGWFAKQKSYGVSGAKIDFFNRSDQIAMNWGKQFAQELADNQMVGLYHGCPVPTGMNRTYPNILNYEAVCGAEDNYWRSNATPDYHTLFPFIRSLAGPVDYTPGSLRNVTQYQFTPAEKTPGSIPKTMGTRTHELSMYIIFDQWLGFLCDAPTEYEKYPDILDFLASVPTVWDKTIPLDARLGEYILLAKQTGNDWYVGGMTNWNARDISVDFSFLQPDVSYKATILRDGNNASNYPTRYICEEIMVTKETALTLNMAKGGGFVIRLVEVEETGFVKSTNSTSVVMNKETGQLNVQSKERLRSIQICNLAGQILFNKKITNEEYTQQINIADLKEGTYIINIQTESTLDSLKFIY